MPLFQFKSIDVNGKITVGTTHAGDRSALAKILDGQGQFLMEEKSVAEAGPERPAAAAPAPAAADFHLAFLDAAVPPEKVAMFTEEFAIMVHAGLPILAVVQTLAAQQGDPVLRSKLAEIAKGVAAGEPLSKAFSRYPSTFDSVYTSLLAAGEAAGNLPVMLDRLSAHLNFRRALRDKVRSAMLYPAVVVLTAVLVVAFLVIFILPTFAEIFAQFDMELPLPTRVLLFLSAHIRSWWGLYLGLSCAAGEYARRWSDVANSHRDRDLLLLQLPVLGPVVKSIVMTRVLRTLSTLVASGIPILKSLELVKKAAGNVVFEEILEKVALSASEGGGLAPALSESEHIPRQVVHMTANAEKTGTLPEVLVKIADYYEKEADTSIKNLFAALEPAFVLGLGLLVGGIAVAVLLPIFSLGTGIK